LWGRRDSAAHFYVRLTARPELRCNGREQELRSESLLGVKRRGRFVSFRSRADVLTKADSEKVPGADIRFGAKPSRADRRSYAEAVVDGKGLPLRLGITAGEAHDNRLCSTLLSGLAPQTMVLADRGYDADWVRAFVNEQGAWANIPPKRNRRQPICFSPHLYRARNLIERFFNKIKHCRRIATRYDKLAANYLAFVQLASIRLWLRVYEFTT
jgi:transposase